MFDSIQKLVRGAMDALRENKKLAAEDKRQARELTTAARTRLNLIRDAVIEANPLKASMPLEVWENRCDIRDIDKPENVKFAKYFFAHLRRIDQLTATAATQDIRVRAAQRENDFLRGTGLLLPGDEDGGDFALLDDFERGEAAACGGRIGSEFDDDNLGNVSRRMDCIRNTDEKKEKK